MIQKLNKRIKRNKVNSVKVNNELATNEKFSLVSQFKKTKNKDQNKHAPANDDNKSAKEFADKEKKTSSFTWKKGTVLITGDSMLNGIDESKLQMKCDVKVRPFSGAITEDMHSYLKALLKKGPTTVFLHIGTNDATENEIDSN